MDKSFDYSTYLSPFTTRYGSMEMRHIWSEENKRKLWRHIWVALAKAEANAGIVTKEELEDIIAHEQDIAIDVSRKREEKVYHELMSEIQTYCEQCTIGGGKIHLGATSTDILDNATIIQIKKSLEITEEKLRKLLTIFTDKIEEHQNTACMGYTHLQPAEPTTLGYRFAFYAQDLLIDLQFLEKIKPFITGKGLKGAVGTSASFDVLLQNSPVTPEQLEKDFLKFLDIDASDITNQTYPRKIDLLAMELLANIAASINKFCFDYRILQSPMFGEWMEKRNSERVGSSAMPFKRNPDKAEKVCSLCRVVSSFLPLAWSNPSLSLLERTLDDSASQRIFLPEAFLAIDECLNTTITLLENLVINTHILEKNLSTFGQFSATEPLLMELVKNGANRQEMHELIKSSSMEVWQRREMGQEVSLFSLLEDKPKLLQYISKKQLRTFSSPSYHIGLAKTHTKKILGKLKKILTK